MAAMVEAVASTVAAEAFMVAWAEVASGAAWVEVASVAAGSVAAERASLVEVIGADMATDTVVGTAEVTADMAVMEATDMDRASWAV
ncbi:hypothetical protein [Bradyrhizobium sp.]|uniref:hypothetical protein n=1 Tax=Bradyrhizobium sp. TaxID=376 RepID=UPI003C6902A2